MKTTATQTDRFQENKNGSAQNLWPYLATLLTILMVSASLLAAHAQSGKLKLKGDIINVEENEQSLITLFRVDGNNELISVLGQFIVEGSNWFKTHLELDKRYVLEIASTNGLTNRYVLDMTVPEFAEDSKYKMEMEFDMGYEGTDWPIVYSGEFEYDRSSDGFSYDEMASDNSMTHNPQ